MSRVQAVVYGLIVLGLTATAGGEEAKTQSPAAVAAGDPIAALSG